MSGDIDMHSEHPRIAATRKRIARERCAAIDDMLRRALKGIGASLEAQAKICEAQRLDISDIDRLVAIIDNTDPLSTYGTETRLRIIRLIMDITPELAAITADLTAMLSENPYSDR